MTCNQSAWHDISGEEFSKAIDEAYGQTVHWIPNSFMVPSGSSGKKFIGELAKLYDAFASESSYESFAIKAAMTMPALLLQKPHSKSKTRDHISCLSRRLELWEKGNITELLKEGKMIQSHLRSSFGAHPNDDSEKLARTFSKLMMEGRIRAALRLLRMNTHTGLLSLDEVINNDSGKTVQDVLEEKHPDAKPAHAETIMSQSGESDFHPVIFESITPEVIRKCALQTEGAAGPSGVDAMNWRRFCTAFGEKSNDLCSAVARCARRLCTSYVDPASLMAYTACRLIPLNKCPGVRPIGIGEVVRRIIGKAIMRSAKQDLQAAVGSLQLCAGQDAGCEAAVHAMSNIFQEESTEAMIFVDASNAFNNLNRQATLLNVTTICPSLAPALINTYRNPSRLFVGGKCLLSKEGTTQGDPLAMAMYAIGTKPLIDRLNGISKQVWYADDSAAGSTVENIKRWWDELVEFGPLYGYYPNSSKTHILTKPDHVQSVRDAFKTTDITISTDGKGYLGGALGSTAFIKHFMESKIESWVDEVKTLSNIAKSQPHAAYAAFTHGLYSKWNYVLRVIDLESHSLSELLQPLETAIMSTFFSALTGQSPPGETIRKLLSLPTHLGGLSLVNPLDTSIEQHRVSKLISAPLVNRVIDQNESLEGCHLSQQRLKSAANSEKQSQRKEVARDLCTQLPEELQRCVELSQEKGASVWLTALPIENHGFALHKSAFRDALCLRYNWPLNNQPSQCSCGHSFSIDHALSCPTGGFPSIRHNEVRDITASLLSEVCHSVSIEPHLQPLSGETMPLRSANIDDNSRLDIAACGFWGSRFERAFFDVRVFNPCARSNRQASLLATYRRHEQEKKRQYDRRIREVEHSTFTPLVLSTTGGMGRAATTFYKRLAAMLSEKRDVPYSKMIGWIRCRMSFSLLRASVMSIRGTRSSATRGALHEPIELQATEGQLQVV